MIELGRRTHTKTSGLRNILALGSFLLVLWMLPAAGQSASGSAYRLHVDGLACPFCAYGIEKQLSRIEGVEVIKIDIASGAVEVRMAAGENLDEETARTAVDAAGFTLRKFARVGGLQ